MCIFKKKKKDSVESKSVIEVKPPKEYSIEEIDSLLAKHKSFLDNNVTKAKKEIEEYTNKFTDLYPQVKELMIMCNKCKDICEINKEYKSNDYRLTVKKEENGDIKSFIISRTSILDSEYTITYNYKGGVLLPSFEDRYSKFPQYYPSVASEFKESYTSTLELIEGVKIHLFSKLQNVEELMKLNEKLNEQNNE